MRHQVRLSIHLVIGATLLCVCADAQGPSKDITGKTVTNNGTGIQHPVPKVKVCVKNANPENCVESGDHGEFNLGKIANGIYTLLASNEQFFPSALDNVAAGQKVVIQLAARGFQWIGNEAVADVDPADAPIMLEAARATGDTTAEYLLLNRLSQSNPGLYKYQADAFVRLLEDRPALFSGTVTSLHGSYAPNAKLTFTNEMTKAVFETTADGSGKYHAALFPAGNYQVRVALPGSGVSESDLDVALRPSLTETENFVVH